MNPQALTTTPKISMKQTNDMQPRSGKMSIARNALNDAQHRRIATLRNLKTTMRSFGATEEIWGGDSIKIASLCNSELATALRLVSRSIGGRNRIVLVLSRFIMFVICFFALRPTLKGFGLDDRNCRFRDSPCLQERDKV